MSDTSFYKKVPTLEIDQKLRVSHVAAFGARPQCWVPMPHCSGGRWEEQDANATCGSTPGIWLDWVPRGPVIVLWGLRSLGAEHQGVL